MSIDKHAHVYRQTCVIYEFISKGKAHNSPTQSNPFIKKAALGGIQTHGCPLSRHECSIYSVFTFSITTVSIILL